MGIRLRSSPVVNPAIGWSVLQDFKLECFAQLMSRSVPNEMDGWKSFTFNNSHVLPDHDLILSYSLVLKSIPAIFTI